MREIKFRAIRHLSHPHFKTTFFSLEDLMRGKVVFAYPEEWVISQFTGLHDKNGKEIYEGDIVRCSVGGGVCHDYTVEWEEEKNGGDVFAGFVFPPDHDEFEVIGNIYENPKLLQ